MKQRDRQHPGGGTVTAVLDVSGIQRASSRIVAEASLLRRPGVVSVEANPVAQTATVTYDPTHADLVQLRDWVRDCGFHCAGQSVPQQVRDPMHDDQTALPATREAPVRPVGHADHAAAPAAPAMSSHEAMGHGGHGAHGAMSMADVDGGHGA